MSYESQTRLEADPVFRDRSWACVIQQAGTFKDDARPDIAALAHDCLRGDGAVISTFCTSAAAGPGIADRVDTGDGSIDQALVTDADLLALTQANWPTVAALYYGPDGAPI